MSCVSGPFSAIKDLFAGCSHLDFTDDLIYGRIVSEKEAEAAAVSKKMSSRQI